MHSFDGFPVKTAAEFAQLLVAIGASGKDAPKPTPLSSAALSVQGVAPFVRSPRHW